MDHREHYITIYIYNTIQKQNPYVYNMTLAIKKHKIKTKTNLRLQREVLWNLRLHLSNSSSTSSLLSYPRLGCLSITWVAEEPLHGLLYSRWKQNRYMTRTADRNNANPCKFAPSSPSLWGFNGYLYKYMEDLVQTFLCSSFVRIMWSPWGYDDLISLSIIRISLLVERRRPVSQGPSSTIRASVLCGHREDTMIVSSQSIRYTGKWSLTRRVVGFRRPPKIRYQGAKIPPS